MASKEGWRWLRFILYEVAILAAVFALWHLAARAALKKSRLFRVHEGRMGLDCLTGTQKGTRMDARGGIQENLEPPGCVANSSAAPVHLTNLSLWWTIGPGNSSDIVEEQIQALRSSGLLQELDSVNFWARDYVRFNTGSAEYSPDELPLQAWFQRLFGRHGDLLGKLRPAHLDAAAVRWWLAQERSYEFPPLEAAHRFCETVDNPRQHAILYLHTKGSSYFQPAGPLWRHVMQHFAVWKYRSCLRHLACGYHTCGASLLMVENPVYAGNFWWARCDYIRYALATPRPSAQTLVEGSEGGREYAETWLMSGALRGPTPTYHKSCWGGLSSSWYCFLQQPPDDQEC